MKRMKQAAALVLAVLLLSGSAVAFVMPEITQVSTLEELLAAYKPGSALQLTQDITIDHSVVLNGDGFATELAEICAVGGSLRIVEGGSLSIDNKQITIQGPGTLIIVEAGGTLNLTAGGIYGNEEDASIPAIAVKKGGIFRWNESDFPITAANKIADENESIPTSPPTEPTDPPTEPDDGIDGTPTPELPGPITTLSVEVMTIGECTATIRLIMPQLEQSITALYIWQSADGENWKKIAWGDGETSEENYLSQMETAETGCALTGIFASKNNDAIYIRVEVIGSVQEGLSNSVLALRGSTSPKPTPGGDEDDSSGGNRGGGGQGESDRVIPPEPKPEAVPEPEPDSKREPPAPLSPEISEGAKPVSVRVPIEQPTQPNTATPKPVPQSVKTDIAPETPAPTKPVPVAVSTPQTEAPREVAETVKHTGAIPGFALAGACTLLVVGGTAGAAAVWKKRKK